MDRVILGKGCYLDDGVGVNRPNDNQIIVGCSGVGKSMSVMLPTILNMNESSMIATYSKAGDAKRIALYQRCKGYVSEICDLTDPDKSTIGFDPLRYVNSYLDIEDLAKSIILADPNSNNPKDCYWNDSAASLLTALMLAVMMTQDNATMTDVLETIDMFTIKEDGKGIKTSLDALFEAIKREAGMCQAVSAFSDFQQLPYATAGCVRDTLAKAVRRLFPEPIRKMMKMDKQIDFREIANSKMSLIIITSPVNMSLYLFANLIFSTAIKQMLEYAERCEGQRLPRRVRLMFDDFACGSKMHNFSRQIAIFRCAGLSTMMLLQSESQLNSIYTDAEAATILDNVSAYVYFPGGLDITTCRNISQRMDVPMSDIMYAPMGKVIIMQSGKKPITVPRYDIYRSQEYLDFMDSTYEKANEQKKSAKKIFRRG